MTTQANQTTYPKIVSVDTELAKREAKTFYQRHKTKLKWGLYIAGGVAVGAGAYYAYTRLGGSANDVVEVVADVAE